MGGVYMCMIKVNGGLGGWMNMFRVIIMINNCRMWRLNRMLFFSGLVFLEVFFFFGYKYSC